MSYDMVAKECTAGLSRELIGVRLDRRIVDAEEHLASLKAARELLKTNPILEQFHDALTKAGF